MPKIVTRVTFDKAAAKARIMGAANKAVTFTGQQALKDTTQHVPVDQHFLQDSGINNSDDAAQNLTFVLRWDEPCAQYLFHGEVMHGNPTERTYGPERLKFTSALARMEWTKYAHKVYGKDWKTVCQRTLQEELRQ